MEECIHLGYCCSCRAEPHGFCCAVDRELLDTQHVRWGQSDTFSQPFDRFNQLLCRDAVIGPAPFHSCLAISTVAGHEGHFLGAFCTDQWHPQRRDIAAAHGYRGLANFRVIGHHCDVGVHAHLCCARQAIPVDCGNDRFGVVPHCNVTIHVAPQAAVVGDGVGGQTTVGTRFADLANVVTGRESATVASYSDNRTAFVHEALQSVSEFI